jgi:hypothetical protein
LRDADGRAQRPLSNESINKTLALLATLLGGGGFFGGGGGIALFGGGGGGGGGISIPAPRLRG